MGSVQKKRCVIIDDNAETLAMLYLILGSLQDIYELEFYQRADMVLGNLVGVSVIMTDLSMPDMDGYELIGHLVTRRAAVHLIVLSAGINWELSQQFPRAALILTKPPDYERLVAIIRGYYGIEPLPLVSPEAVIAA